MLIIVNTKKAITLLLQNIFSKIQNVFFIACQDLTNDTGFSILKQNTIVGLTSLVQTFCVHRDKSVDINIRAVLAGGWTSRSLASHTFILSFSFHGSQKNEVPGDVFSVCVQPGAQHVGIECELALADSTADV